MSGLVERIKGKQNPWHHRKWLVLSSFVISISELPSNSLCHGVLGKWRYSSTHSLTSSLDGGEWPATRSGRFTPRERVPVTRCMRLGGPQSRSGRGGEGKNPQHLIFSLMASPTWPPKNIAQVSLAFFPNFTQTLILICCSKNRSLIFATRRRITHDLHTTGVNTLQ
jgi:hypothetical protein